MHSRSSGCRSNPTKTKMTTPTEVRRKQTPPRVVGPGDFPAIRRPHRVVRQPPCSGVLGPGDNHGADSFPTGITGRKTLRWVLRRPPLPLGMLG